MKKHLKLVVSTLILSCISVMTNLLITDTATSAIKTEPVDYTSDGEPMEGFVAYDDTISNTRPGILIVHDWMGLGPFTKQKAMQLAAEGNIAFAVDVYGKGIRPKDNDEAAKISSKYFNDRGLLRRRMRSAYDKLASMNDVDSKKIVVMGYCFGGAAALELARCGADLVGTVSFHGILSNPNPRDAENIKGSVLILQAADDPFVPPTQVQAFEKEMKDANINYQIITYYDAVHGFTNPAAGSDKSKGVAYNADADRKSWLDFHTFLTKVLR